MAYSDTFDILNAPATDAEIAELLTACRSELPSGYLRLLRIANGTDAAAREVCRVSLRLYPAQESIRSNAGYQIQQCLPELWMIGDDSGDYGYCFDRSTGNHPDHWSVVECPLGDIHRSMLEVVAASFAEWEQRRFAVITSA